MRLTSPLRPPLQSAAVGVGADEKKSALDPDGWTAFKLSHREQLTHNTHLFRFDIPDNARANLPVASCLLVKGKTTKEDGTPGVAIRPYTPTSPRDAEGYLELVVKVYEQGQCSKYFGGLKEGDAVEMKGPIVKLPWEANKYKEVGMIAGGSGITPMLQVADEVLSNPNDKTKMSLVFANVSEEDIILRDRIEALAKRHPEQFRVHYVVDKAAPGWKGGVGYLTEAILAAHMPKPTADGVMVFVCGPPPMMSAVSGNKVSPKDQGELKGLLAGMGYTASQVFKF